MLTLHMAGDSLSDWALNQKGDVQTSWTKDAASQPRCPGFSDM